MTRGGRRLATIALAVCGLVAGAAGAAWAGESVSNGTGAAPGGSPTRSTVNLPGGTWTEQCYQHETSTACHRGTFQGYREDQNRGSRLQASVGFKEVGWKSDVRGAFAEVQWWSHSNNCYTVNFADPTIACSVGWWRSGFPSRTGNTVSDTYVFWDMWWNLDPGGSSGRGQFYACLDIAWGFDKCTAYVLRGSDY